MAQDKISIRVSRDDIEKLNTLASSLSMTKTALIKKIVNDGFDQTIEITNNDLLASFSKIEKMLESIGNNVNQMARKVNAGGRFTEQDQKALEQVSDRFEKLYDFIATKTKKAVIKKRGTK